MSELARVGAALVAAGSVCVLTGAGMSSESGLPTFRGVNGLWKTHRVEELASPAGFARDPELVWTWYNERRAAHLAAQPNAGHRALATLESRFDDFTLATQNVDSLHVRAGSRNVLELHGHLREARCDRCGARRPLDRALPHSDIEHGCGGRLRPDIVWFGEPLPSGVFERAARAAARADVVLVIGTSGMVDPAASLATRFPKTGALVVEINPEETAITSRAGVVLRETAARALPALLERNLRRRVGTRVMNDDDLAYVSERVPGYLAYAAEDERHDSDMRVRAYVGARLASARARLAPLDAAVEQALDVVQYRCMFTDQAFVKKFEHASLDAAMEAGLVRADRFALALGERLETCAGPELAGIVREIGEQLDYRLSPEPVPAK